MGSSKSIRIPMNGQAGCISNLDQDHRGEWLIDKDEFGKKRMNLEEVLKKQMCPVVTIRSLYSENTYMSHSTHAAVAISTQKIYGEMQEPCLQYITLAGE